MKHRISVIGSTNVDFIMKMPRLPKVGETITDGVFNQTYGGKGANQAVAAARAGGEITFVTCLGDDDFADKIIQNFKSDAIETKFIQKVKGVSTGTALVMIGESDNYLSVAPGSNNELSVNQVNMSLNAIESSEFIIIQLEIPEQTNKYILDLAIKSGKKVLLNYAPPLQFDKSYLKKISVLVANETEAEFITGKKVETEEEVIQAANDLFELCPHTVIITLGKKGCYVKTANETFFSKGFIVNAVDATAAGDTFCGSLTVAITEGKNLKDAVRFAQSAAALAVTKLGAQPSIPHREEIETFLSKN
jgi:ribokinase